VVTRHLENVYGVREKNQSFKKLAAVIVQRKISMKFLCPMICSQYKKKVIDEVSQAPADHCECREFK